MTDPDFSIKRHDLLPSFQVTLQQKVTPDLYQPIDLTLATGVKFIMKADTGGTVLKGSCVIVDALNGVVRYDWQTGDTAVSGTYTAEWEIMWPGNKPQTVPTRSYYVVEIPPDLDNA